MRCWTLIFVICILFGIWCLGFGAFDIQAIYDPLSVPNNIFGVHILEPSEVFQAVKLVNSSGGKWGYVTIPIRTDDRDKNKWTNFMIACRQNNLIPILRISSYATGNNWASPPDSELTDFANFLNDLPWPVKNRYIIIYNEPNHSQEWGGYVSPSEYSSLLISAHDIFKNRSQDFFVISAGLDMSVPTSATSLDALRYLRQMTQANPGWYRAIDGLAFHAYPNPGYLASVWSVTRYGITSYRYEISLLKSMGFASKPIFITETGYLGKDQFYKPAFTKVWTDKNLVAVTPFVLFAGAGDFARFSLLDINNQPADGYKEIIEISKISGSPLLNDFIKSMPSGLSFTSGSSLSQPKSSFLQKIIDFFIPPKPKVIIGNSIITVEIAEDMSSYARGLSGRKNLLKDSGMLFKMPVSRIESFWMNDMKFALDFIWINDKRVVKLDKNIPPPGKTNGRPVILTSSVPVNQVLEVSSGFIDANNIKIGDPVMLNLPQERR